MAGNIGYEMGVRFFGDTKALDKSLTGINKKLGGLGKAAKSFGRLLGVSFSVYGIKKIADMGKQMSNLAAQTGMSVASLSAMSSAFKLMGSSAGTASRIIGKMNQAAIGLNMGKPETAARLASMGIATMDRSGRLKSGQALMMETANWARQKSKEGIDRRMLMAVLQDLGFDAASASMAISGGAGAFYAKQAKAKSLGLWSSDRESKNLKGLSVALDTITSQFQYLAMDVISPFAELINPLLNDFSKYLGGALNVLKGAHLTTAGNRFAGAQAGGDLGLILGRETRPNDKIIDFGNGTAFNATVFGENLKLIGVGMKAAWEGIKAPFEAIYEAGKAGINGYYWLKAGLERENDLNKSSRFAGTAFVDGAYQDITGTIRAQSLQELKELMALKETYDKTPVKIDTDEPLPVTGTLTINMTDANGNTNIYNAELNAGGV